VEYQSRDITNASGEFSWLGLGSDPDTGWVAFQAEGYQPLYVRVPEELDGTESETGPQHYELSVQVEAYTPIPYAFSWNWRPIQPVWGLSRMWVEASGRVVVGRYIPRSVAGWSYYLAPLNHPEREALDDDIYDLISLPRLYNGGFEVGRLEMSFAFPDTVFNITLLDPSRVDLPGPVARIEQLGWAILRRVLREGVHIGPRLLEQQP